MDNIKKHLERLDEIKSVCSVNGWWDVDTLAIPEKVYKDTEEIIPIIPKLFEMSGCPDKSIQFEFSENRRNDFWVIIEIYENKYRISNNEDEIEYTNFELFKKDVKQMMEKYFK